MSYLSPCYFSWGRRVISLYSVPCKVLFFFIFLFLRSGLSAFELEAVPWSAKKVPAKGCLSFEEANQIAKESFPYKIDKEGYVKTVLEAPIFDYLKKFQFEKALWPKGATAKTVVLDGRGLGHCPVDLTGYALGLNLIFQTKPGLSSHQLIYRFKVEDLWVSIEAPEELKAWARREGTPEFLQIEPMIAKMEKNSRVASFLARFPKAKAWVTISGVRFEDGDFYLSFSWQNSEVLEYRLPPDMKSAGFPEFDKEIREFDPQAYLKRWYYSSARCREANVKSLQMTVIEGFFRSEYKEWSVILRFQKNDCVETKSWYWKLPAERKRKN